MSDPDRYAITVRKVLVGDEDTWRATVRELPDLAEFADTREEAVALARDAIQDLQEAAAAEGRQFPDPIEDEEEYSGRVTLRMPKHLHRAVAQEALEQDVSLNLYIVTRLAESVRGRPTGASTVSWASTAVPASGFNAATVSTFDWYSDYIAKMMRKDLSDVSDVLWIGTGSTNTDSAITAGVHSLSFVSAFSPLGAQGYHQDHSKAVALAGTGNRRR